MRLTFAIPVLVLSALFLCSVLSPEPDYVQGYNSTGGFPTFVESDAACWLCTGCAFVPEGHHPTGRLPLLERAWFVASPFIATHSSRAPPFFV